jgi:hypothetical protein
MNPLDPKHYNSVIRSGRRGLRSWAVEVVCVWFHSHMSSLKPKPYCKSACMNTIQT